VSVSTTVAVSTGVRAKTRKPKRTSSTSCRMRL
jgi:hypothetical protein